MHEAPKPRLLVFGADFLYELVHASPDFDIDFYATVSPRKFVLLPKIRAAEPDSLERCPVHWTTLADLRTTSEKLRAGAYHAVICQQVEPSVWSPLQPPHRNVRLAIQTLTRERRSLFRWFMPRMVARSGVPMAFVSQADVATIPVHNVAMVRAATLCFIRELPIEPGHLLLNAWP